MLLAYHLRSAWRSLRRDAGLSAIMIVGLALGVGLWGTAHTALSAHRDRPPLPQDLYHVELVRDSGLDRVMPVDHPWGMATLATAVLPYRDAQALRRHLDGRQTAATFVSRAAVTTPDGAALDWYVRPSTVSLFSLFGLRFTYGGPWQQAPLAPAVVLDHESNQRLFGGHNSVGRTLRIRAQTFRITGVLAPTRSARVYDYAFPVDPMVVIPFDWTEPLQLRPAFPMQFGPSSSHFADFLAGEAGWVHLWAKLPDGQRDSYARWLGSYAMREQQRGRQLIIGSRLRPVDNWYRFSVPVSTGYVLFGLFAWIALLGCMFNLMRLLMAKFRTHAGELNMRRALGAPRRAIFVQLLVEAELVAVLGTGLGLLLAVLGLWLVNHAIVHRAMTFALDPLRLLLIVAAGLGAGLLSAILPAWQLCRQPPATRAL